MADQGTTPNIATVATVLSCWILGSCAENAVQLKRAAEAIAVVRNVFWGFQDVEMLSFLQKAGGLRGK